MKKSSLSKTLRQQAEEKLGQQKTAANPATEADTQRLIHELQVHQVELEIRNEELVQARAETEAVLRQYTDLYDFAPVGYFTLAQDGMISKVNLAGAALLGVKRENLIKRCLAVFVPAQSLETLKAFLYRVFTGGEKEACEIEFLKAGSAPLWAHIEAAIDSGERETCRAVVVDITERKRAEEALAESEDKFKYVFDYSVLGKSITLPSGELNVNRAFCEMLGYSQAELKSRKWQEISHPDDVELTQNMINSLLAGEKESVRFTKRYFHKNGSVIWADVCTALRRDKDGKPLYFMTTISDTTERMRIEDALKESETRFSTAFHTSSIGISITRLADGQYIDVNEAFLSLFGYTREEALSHTSLQLQTWAFPEDRDRVVKIFREQGRAQNIEAQYHRKSGEIWTGLFSAAVMGIAGDQHILVLLQDITERKQADKAVKSAKAFLDTVVDMSPFAMWISDKEGTLMRANRSLRDTINLTDDKIVGKYNVLKDKNLEIQGVMPMVMAVFEKHEPARFSIPWKAADVGDGDFKGGHDLYIDVSMFPILNAQGELTNVVCQWVDITDRKRMDDALRESETELRALINAVNESLFLMELDGTVVAVNETTAARLGVRTADMIGHNIYSFLPPDVAETRRAYMEQVIATGKLARFEDERYEKWVDNSIYPVKDETGGVKLLAVYGYDITERKRAEEEIRKLNAELEQRVIERAAQLQTAYNQLESELAERKRAQDALREIEERLRRLSEAAFEAIIIHDGGILLSANNQYCEMFGYEPEELLGKQVMPLTIAPDAIQTVKKEIATGGAGPYESTGLKKDGTRFPMEIRVREMEIKGRRVRVAAIMDITERKRAEEALQQRAAQLEAANKELEAFSYSVSHDLRAPLRGIDGWSLALLEDYGSQLDGQAKTYLERVRSETQRMGHLIDDLLQLSRLARVEMSINKVNLSAFAGTIANQLQKAQPERQVEFVIQPGLNANGDAQLLEIALTNLLDNAFKFTGKTPQARIEFGQIGIEGQHAFFVRDNGAGFDMALAKKLFGAFQRLHKASDFPGTGIGLTTVQRIIHRHGGRIWAESAINRGATFYFTLEEIP